MKIQGLHHITLVSSNAQRTVDFYTQVLGQRLVKKTVNFDDPGSYHLYFGNSTGQPGTVITYFEWPNAPKGQPGIGGTHHYALIVKDYDGLLMWKRYLTDLAIAVDGPLDRHYFTSIYFRDPDGVIIEIATEGPGWTVDETIEDIGAEYREPPAEMVVRNRDEERIRLTTWPDSVPNITGEMTLDRGMHHITAIGTDIERSHSFLSGVLGLRRVKMTSNFDDPTSAHWYWGTEDGPPGSLITYFERDPEDARYHRVRMGAGQTHHYAFSVPDEKIQLQFREKLLGAGYHVSQVLDRVYFKSIYTRDPDGHIVELATAGPGFTADEDEVNLGRTLKLPPWLESQRDDIERRVRPITGQVFEEAE